MHARVHMYCACYLHYRQFTSQLGAVLEFNDMYSVPLQNTPFVTREQRLGLANNDGTPVRDLFHCGRDFQAIHMPYYGVCMYCTLLHATEVSTLRYAPLLM